MYYLFFKCCKERYIGLLGSGFSFISSNIHKYYMCVYDCMCLCVCVYVCMYMLQYRCVLRTFNICCKKQCLAVVKFIEMPEHEEEKKSKEKFKIVSLKVKPGVEFTPEMVRS